MSSGAGCSLGIPSLPPAAHETCAGAERQLQTFEPSRLSIWDCPLLSRDEGQSLGKRNELQSPLCSRLSPQAQQSLGLSFPIAKCLEGRSGRRNVKLTRRNQQPSGSSIGARGKISPRVYPGAPRLQTKPIAFTLTNPASGPRGSLRRGCTPFSALPTPSCIPRRLISLTALPWTPARASASTLRPKSGHHAPVTWLGRANPLYTHTCTHIHACACPWHSHHCCSRLVGSCPGPRIPGPLCRSRAPYQISSSAPSPSLGASPAPTAEGRVGARAGCRGRASSCISLPCAGADGLEPPEPLLFSTFHPHGLGRSEGSAPALEERRAASAGPQQGQLHPSSQREQAPSSQVGVGSRRPGRAGLCRV